MATDVKRDERPRAVFSTADFRLMRTAIAHYLDTAGDTPEAAKLGSLYHRLGRLD